MSKLKQLGTLCRTVLPITAVLVLFILVTSPVSAAASRIPLTSIQQPASGQMLSGTVEGFAVNASGIQAVNIYAVDSHGKSTLIGTTEVDGATGGNYSASVNDSMLKAGSYTLAVEGVGNDNHVERAEEPIQIGPASSASLSSSANGTTEKDTAQISGQVTNDVRIGSDSDITGSTKAVSVVPPASISIGSPSDNATESGSFTVSGQAVNHSGVSRVDVYAYNSQGKPTYIGTASASGSSYTAKVDVSQLPAGHYILAVAAIGNDNDVVWATRNLTVGPAATTSIAAPSDWASITGGSFTVSGRVTNHSGIDRVDAYAYDSQGRPTYIGTDTGSDGSYSIQADANTLKAGNYTLAVAGIGNDGEVVWGTKAVSIIPPASISISSPSDNATEGGGFTVSGRASNHSGVGRVDVYAYNSQGKPTYIGTGSASGSSYTAQVDVSQLPAGHYILAVAAIGNDSDVVWATRNLTVGPAAATSIAAPSDWASITGSSFTLSGYVRNRSGIGRVDAYAYDSQGRPTYIGTDTGSDGSYSIQANASALKAGNYTLAVAGIGNDGEVVWGTKAVSIGPAASISIGSPSDNATEGGGFTVSGRASNHSGVGRVDVYAYNSQGKPTYIGTGSASGSSYTAQVDVSQLPAGHYVLAVAGIGNDSDVVWSTRSLNVGPAPVTTINTPANGSVVSSTLTVKGWALNHSEVGRVDIYLYDSQNKAHFIGSVYENQLQHTTATQSAYPQYGSNPQCDYTFTYDMNQIGAGTYLLAAAGIGNDGDVIWATKAITYAAHYVSYNISLQQMEADHPKVDPTALNPTALFNYDSVSKYELMSLNWVDGVTAADLNSMLSGCGNLAGHGQDFLDAAKAHNINPVYLVAHARLETGNGSTTAFSRLDNGIVFKGGKEYYINSSGDLSPVYDSDGNQVTGSLVSGSTYAYTDPHQYVYNVTDGTYYNLWGIHAYDGVASWGGGIWAGYKNWNSIREAVFGGAEWIAENYTTGQNYAQNTLYTMKWDPYGWSIGSPYEYATDYNSITDNWAYDVAKIIHDYASIFDHTAPLVYYFPQYRN